MVPRARVARSLGELEFRIVLLMKGLSNMIRGSEGEMIEGSCDEIYSLSCFETAEAV